MSTVRISDVAMPMVLNYLGYGGASPSEADMMTIEDEIKELMNLSQVYYIMRSFELEGMRIVGTSVEIPGKSAQNLLDGCFEVILLAATLGPQIDRWIQRGMTLKPELGVIRDAIASSAIETKVQEINRAHGEKLSVENYYLTRRFSPGYGDVPIEFSREICRLLDTTRTIGLSFSDSGILMPRKSITAFIGVSVKPQIGDMYKCRHCNMADNCRFYKRGDRCDV